jgi:signal transduction histidine kinase
MDQGISRLRSESRSPCLRPETPLNSWQQQLNQMKAESDSPQSLETGLASPEERLHLALGAGRMGTWELRLDHPRPLVLSAEFMQILGMTDRGFDGCIATFLASVHPSDRWKLIRNVRRSIARGADPEYEFRFEGGERAGGWLLCRGRIDCGKEGRPQRLLGVAIDVTRQKSAELEILRLNSELDRRVQERTGQLEAINKELEAFCYSVSHDLRAPLRSIRGFNEVLLERYSATLDARGQEFLRRACQASQHMDELIESLLKLSRVGRAELLHQQVDLSGIAKALAAELMAGESRSGVVFQIAPGLKATGDEHLIRVVLDNLLRNSWKFTSKKAQAVIEVGRVSGAEPAFFVRDNGAGFDPAYTNRLFGVFQRLHSSADFPGTGVGLATVQRIINRHGGRVWATGAMDEGATFFFSLPSHETV